MVTSRRAYALFCFLFMFLIGAPAMSPWVVPTRPDLGQRHTHAWRCAR